jgi:hypothetical protein
MTSKAEKGRVPILPGTWSFQRPKPCPHLDFNPRKAALHFFLFILFIYLFSILFLCHF